MTIVVLTQCREHLICRTYEALKGAKRAIVHFYNSVSVLQREVVFRKNKEEIKKLATDAAELCKDLENEAKGIDLYYEYSPNRSPVPSRNTRSRCAMRSSASSSRPPSTR